MRFVFILFVFYFLTRVNCKDSDIDAINKTTNSENNLTNVSIDSSFDFDDFDDQNKMMLNLNQNCSTHEDCYTKHSVCDSTYNTCECDLTSMQTQLKCRTVYCQTSEECMMKFIGSFCTLGRCQCMSGRKMNGQCVRSMRMLPSNPIPDWAIISIAVTLALTVIAGGSLKKEELRHQLMAFIRLFLQRSDTDPNPNVRANNDKVIEL